MVKSCSLSWVYFALAIQFFLTLFRMGLFGATHGWGRGKKLSPSLPKICHTYLRIMKLGAVIPHLKKILKSFKSRDTPLAFC